MTKKTQAEYIKEQKGLSIQKKRERNRKQKAKWEAKAQKAKLVKVTGTGMTGKEHQCTS